MGEKTPAYAFWKIVEVGAVTGAGYMLLVGLTGAVLFGSLNPIVILIPILPGTIMGVMVAFAVAVPAVGLHLLASSRSPMTQTALAAAGGAVGPLLGYQLLAPSQPIDPAGFAVFLLLALASALTAVHYTEGLRHSGIRRDIAPPPLDRTL